MFVRKLLVTSIAAALLTACGSGGGGGGSKGSNTEASATASLTMPEQVDMVSAKTSGVAANLRSIKARAFNDAGTDYDKAEQNAHVWHPALQPAETVNSILCFIGQLKGEQFATASGHSYIAMIDDVGCDKGSDQGSSSQSQASGADTTVSYINAIVSASRASDTAPLQVKAWIPEMDMDGGNVVLLINIEVTAGPSEEKPYGDFHMSFAFFPSMDAAVTNGTVNESAAMGKGELYTIESGSNVGFNFIMQKSGDSLGHDLGQDGPEIPQNAIAGISIQEKVAVLTSADGNSGSGVTQRTINGLPPELKEQLKTFAEDMFKAYGVVYNDNNVLVGKSDDVTTVSSTDTKQCLSRDNFYEAVWRYGVYDANSGAEVKLNSGFPFRYSSNNNGSKDAFGYVGYWGLWTQDRDADLDGKTVSKQSFSDNGQTAEENFTLHVKPGRLIKKTVQTLEVANLGDTQFDYNSSEGGNFRAKFKFAGTESAGFYKTAQVSYQGEGGPSETPTACTDNANAGTCASSLIEPMPGQPEIFMYSQQLGGGVRWKSGADKIIFYKEEYVSELASDLNLVCYNQCPRTDITPQMQYFDAYSQAINWNSLPATVSPITYSFPKTGDNAYILLRDNVPVLLSGTSQDWQGSQFSWGLRSGMLIDASVAAANGLPTSSTLAAPDTMNKLYDGTTITEFYEWQTGFDSYNKQIVVTDQGGDVVTFDKPLNFNYVHANSNDRSVANGAIAESPYDGMHFLLQYQGEGQLHGIPHEKLSGSDEEGEGGGRYYPIFTLKDATLLTEGASNYVVKALNIEQFMMEANGQCQSLDLSSTPAAPTSISTDYDIQIGAMPSIAEDTPPSVIGGELQTQ